MTETQKQLVEETLQKICFKLFCKNCKSIAVSYPLDIENQAMIRAELDHALSTATQQAVELERDKLFIKVNTLRLKNLKAFYASRVGTNELYMQGATILLNLIEMWFPERYKEALSQKGEE